ncbi:MAG: tetratricopeptide repeat protein [Desulfobulbus sp.]|jgi:tetratricopeptide (TPR) repeat protein
MAHDNLQPLTSLGPMPKSAADEETDPAKKEYLEGRELFDKGEYAAAAMAFHNALLGFEKQGDQIGVANAADRFGDACLAREEYAMALAHYERAHAICAELDDSFSILSLNRKMATACRKLGNHSRAVELLFDMLEHYRLTNNPKGAVELLIVLAETYQEMGNRTAAADAYRSAAGIHTSFKHPRAASELLQRAEALEQEG